MTTIYTGLDSSRETWFPAKKNGETPFDGRFAQPDNFWCYAHQTAPKADDLWTPRTAPSPPSMFSAFFPINRFVAGVLIWDVSQNYNHHPKGSL